MESKWNFKKIRIKKTKNASNNPIFISKEREEFNEEECFSWLRQEMNKKNTKSVTVAATVRQQ